MLMLRCQHAVAEATACCCVGVLSLGLQCGVPLLLRRHAVAWVSTRCRCYCRNTYKTMYPINVYPKRCEIDGFSDWGTFFK